MPLEIWVTSKLSSLHAPPGFNLLSCLMLAPDCKMLSCLMQVLRPCASWW
jgi:hypothetical protein